jgi:hypothetical protein
MRFSVTDLSYDGKWFEFGDAQLKIKPFPLSRGKVLLNDGSLVISHKEQYEIFRYALEDWKNVTGADGEALKCTNEVKKALYDFGLATDLVRFVIDTAENFLTRKEVLEKNSKTGDGGPTPRTA